MMLKGIDFQNLPLVWTLVVPYMQQVVLVCSIQNHGGSEGEMTMIC